MTAFDQAWDLVKAPLWTEEGTTADYEPEDYTDDERGLTHTPGSIHQRFSLVPTIGTWMPVPHRYWESKDKDARGYAVLQEGDAPNDPIEPYHQISNFELGEDIRGTGQARNRLLEMIAELREYDPSAKSTHVTHSEKHTADFWDKLVDEGLIDSASMRPYVTTTPDGRLIPKTGYSKLF
tara:strand:- start:14492 stop:15031 length:540 start_codon:yes stop_codon:yes gene_type:complete